MLMPFILGKKTNELLFTGHKINAEEALSLGLINKIVPREDVESAARELAMRIAPTPLPILRLTMQTLTAPTRPRDCAPRSTPTSTSQRSSTAQTPERQEFDKGRCGESGPVWIDVETDAGLAFFAVDAATTGNVEGDPRPGRRWR